MQTRGFQRKTCCLTPRTAKWLVNLIIFRVGKGLSAARLERHDVGGLWLFRARKPRGGVEGALCACRGVTRRHGRGLAAIHNLADPGAPALDRADRSVRQPLAVK